MKLFIQLALLALILSACAPAAPATPTATASPTAQAIEYQTIFLPGDEGISFELPKTWKHYGNGYAFSPDQGQTLFGIKQGWIREGQELDIGLIPEESQLVEQKFISVGDKGAKTYTILLFQPRPEGSVGEPKPMGFEWGCIFTSEDGKQRVDLFVRAEKQEELAQFQPVVLHAVETFTMKMDE